MQRLYLDTEFNAHGGQLISLAIAAQDGRHFYAVLDSHDDAADPWVAEHVIPKLYTPPPTINAGQFCDSELFRAALRAYLDERKGAILYADWPADFGYLLSAMVGPSYEQAWQMELRMHLLVTPDGAPEIEEQLKHNALIDAIALMKWHATQI
jgi:hypothetical protein